ncbi:MAG TPA: hypothetical protein VEJ23_09920 [Solirubrobacteraceae bacterium]|nr:hypothetical protein [Solirubrobacteraceae bacterium]
MSSTIEVQAVNIPVDVKPPSPRKTISEKQFERLLRERCGRRPSGKAAASIQGGFTIESC